MSKQENTIMIIRKKQYSCFQSVFCCKCFKCCQDDDVSLLTSRNRKSLSVKLISQYSNQSADSIEQIDGNVNVLQALILLYTIQNKDDIYPYLNQCRINPSFQSNAITRNDIEFYTPQLINYLVFHEEMQNQQLSSFILQACVADFFFAHLVHFALNSVSAIVQKNQTIEFEKVKQYLDEMITSMSKIYGQQNLISFNIYFQNQNQQDNQIPQPKQEIIQRYGTGYFDPKVDLLYSIHPKDIQLKSYSSIFQTNQELDSYHCTIQFWEDLIKISENLSYADPKIISLKADINKLNEKLPAAIYIPFVKNSIRNNVILNIIGSESKVFSTKERAPFYICLEIYRPEEEQEQISAADQQLSKPITTVKFQNRKSEIVLPTNTSKENSFISSSYQHRSSILDSKDQKEIELNQPKVGIADFYEKKFDQQMIENDFQRENQNNGNNQVRNIQHQESLSIDQNQVSSHRVSEISQDSDFPIKNISKKSMKMYSLQKLDKKTISNEIFGESQEEQEKRLRKMSPFGGFQSWKMVHLIVKTGDNLKQEEFALQLIKQFDQIFRLEELPLLLTPYEIVSMGPSYGIIEMVKDACTIDSLKKKIQSTFRDINNLSNFFSIYYENDVKKAQENFCNSLAAYCLVCYFLQIKDRHNGNILLHRDGKILHIDFGFFLSISPGKGLEFERNVPFKLMTEYLEVLGGVKSELFGHFRRLFFKYEQDFIGFQACQKHQDKILLLAKMMYSGHGYTLPCFGKGEQAIIDLENRFNPNVGNDGELFVFSQNLINQALDNWRARWYDKYQYYFQGIFY